MGNFKVTVKETFDAAHRLLGHKGKCANLHGHTWAVELTVESDFIDEQGMVVDFFDLKKILKEIVAKMDHQYINDIKPFDVLPPTSENLAKFIYESVVNGVEALNGRAKLSSVTVSESPYSSATYSA